METAHIQRCILLRHLTNNIELCGDHEAMAKICTLNHTHIVATVFTDMFVSPSVMWCVIKKQNGQAGMLL